MSLTAFAFPARSIYSNVRVDIPKSLEIYSVDEIEGVSSHSVGKLEVDDRMFNHYLVGIDELSNLDLPFPEPLWPSGGWGASAYREPAIMAVINATPDSFYQGSRIQDDLKKIDSILDSKPDIIDVGGESTRPGSGGINWQDEAERIRPVIDYLSSASDIPISLDTKHFKVADRFRDRIDYINDITGFIDQDMVALAAETKLKCIAMHMRGTPSTMMSLASYGDVIAETILFLQERVVNLTEAGVNRSNIIVDPGLGFAKGFQGNMDILHNIRSYHFGYPVLVGPSRKSFIGYITGKPPEGRLPGTIAVNIYLAQMGTEIIRVHDPGEARDAIKVASALFSSSEYRRELP